MFWCLIFLRRLAFPEDFRVEALNTLNLAYEDETKVNKMRKSVGATPAISAKNFARNHWIFSNLVRPSPPESLFTPRMLKQLAFYVCPLETLITLNGFYDTLSRHSEGGALTTSEFLRDFSVNSMHHLFYPSLRFPASLRMRVLLEIGFDPQEASQILLSKNKIFSDRSTSGMPKMERIMYV